MNVQNITNTIILYFKIKKLDTKPYFNYKFYSKEIRTITKINDKDTIRLIFNELLKKKALTKIKVLKSTFYYFDPYQNRLNHEPKNKKNNLTVYFD
jgi:hypothetical protein